MAMFSMPIDPSDPQFQSVRRMMSPRSISQSIESVLSMLWMTLPAKEQRMMSLESAARLMFADVISDWRSTDPAERTKGLQDDAAALMKDAPAGGEADITAEAGASSDEANFRKFFSPEMARYSLRNSLLIAQFAFPPGRQDDDTIEKYVRHALECALAAWWEDARILEIGID